MSIREMLYSKITPEKDLRVNAVERKGGMISEFFRIFKTRFIDLVLINLIFLVFLIPFFVIFFWLVPGLVNAINADLNLMGNIGLGYPGLNTDTTNAEYMVLEVFEFAFLLTIPCFTFAGLGASGLFFCARNFMWEANVKTLKHFFRGIKLHWWKFIIIFTLLGGFVALFAYLIIMQLEFIVLKTAAWWSYLVIVICALLALAVFVFFVNLCPLVVHYKFSFKDLIKNASILSVTTPLADLIVVIATALLFLSFISFMSFIIIIFMGFVGFSFYALMYTALAQAKYDGIITPLYEQKINPNKKTFAVKDENKNKNKNNLSAKYNNSKKGNGGTEKAVADKDLSVKDSDKENVNIQPNKNNSINKNKNQNYRPPYKKKKKPTQQPSNNSVENDDSMKIEITNNQSNDNK